MKGKVQTVNGIVEPLSLGCCMTHEHLSIAFNVAYVEPKEEDKHMVNCDFTTQNIGWIRQNPYSHKPNLVIEEAEVKAGVIAEVKKYHKLGGGTIVENTTCGIQRDINFLKQVSSETGVHIVAGTGYYINAAQKATVLKIPVEKMVEVMVHELEVGCLDAPNIKCGIIGEVGCSWPLYDFERKSIQAAAETQQVTGCPVIFHPGRHKDAPEEIIRIYEEAGGAVDKAVMSHLDRTIHKLDDLLDFAAMGSYCEFDLFGLETSHYQLNIDVDMPSDAQRIERIKHLIDHGFGDHILISHDIHTKIQLESFGGYGYCHILRNVVPKMLRRGYRQEDIDKMLKINPQRWLAFTK
ncbi:N-acetyltaurine hydrolase isoform X2 [Oratosquilla oratoria]|uniref:N-acetyltaurine hydrolase isoform X2 n=1 Tax=Oratosquilla oratoria TaxID=337810 RepID=UPI003F75DEB1